MPRSRSPLAIIFVTIFIDLVGFGIVIPVLPLYAERYGASETVAGLLLAVYSVMQFIFAPVLGRISDLVGRRPVLLVSLLGTSVGFLLMGLASHLPKGIALFGMSATLIWLFIARLIDGMSGGNISTAQAYIADVTPPEERARGMGLIGAAFGLGFTCGPVIGGVMSHISPEAPFFLAAGLAAANATALYFFLPESLSPEHRGQARRRNGLMEVLSQAGNWHLKTIMATYFFATVAFAMITTTFALFAKRRFDFDATHTGYMLGYLGLLGALIQGGLLGRLVKIAGEKSLALMGTAIFAVSLFGLPIGDSLAMLLVCSTGIAIGNSFVTPTLNGMASKQVGPAGQGRILGVMTSVASLARIAGPILGGTLLERDTTAVGRPLDHYGRTLSWSGAVLMLIAFGLAVAAYLTESSATAVEQETLTIRDS
jgi:DHA1 family tetracycline resistance protein-like MFS transporter